MTIQRYQSNTPVIDETAYIAEQALIIGQVSIASDSSVWPLTVIRGDVNSISIGANTNIQDNSVLHVTHSGAENPMGNPQGYALSVGNNVTVGHQCLLHGCTIHDHCLIGMGSIVMDGVIVESNTIIGAGSLVAQRQTLESGYLWLGRPARRVRKLTDEEIKAIEYSAQHYVRLKNTYLI